jgi:pyruvate,water dikinase
LDDSAALDPTLVGSKAANIARLLQAAFLVPEGLVVTTKLNLNGGLTENLSAEILNRLGDVPLAVRSSATAEDLPDASYAGQYESYLGVRGRDQLEKAVAATLASLSSDRVSSYASDNPDVAMAVLIQPMVSARAAGVAFSAHPVTGARDQVVVNAVQGLGDRLVSGEVTPDQWIVTGDSVDGEAGALDRSEVLRVAELTRRVEAHFGVPQDIEWAIEGETLWLLQARPITALPRPPVEPIPIGIEVPPGSWEHDGSHFPLPSHPIDTVLLEIVSEVIDTWAREFGYLFDGIEFTDIGGWTYQRLKPIGGKEGPELPRWLMWVLVRTVPMIRRRLAIAADAVKTDKAGRFIRRWNDEWVTELAETITQLQDVDRPSLTDEELLSHTDHVLDLVRRGLEVHTLVHGSLAPILYEWTTTCERLLGWDMAKSLEVLSGTSFKSTEPSRRLHALTEMARDRDVDLDVGSGAEHQVVERLEQHDAEFAAAFRRYMDDYGHRALGEIAEPTIAERPSLILGMIRDQLQTSFDPARIDDDNWVARDRATAAGRKLLEGDSGALAEFERVLARAVEAYPAREDNEFYTMSAPFALARYALLEIGARLTSRGVIEDREDVMFLRFGEARESLADVEDRRDLVLLRRGQRAWAMANPGPPFYGKRSEPPSSLDFLPKDARLPMESMLWSLESIEAVGASRSTQTDPDLITGMPVSAGSHTGTVRVIRNESEFDKLQAGDVLVCPITSPVWSVLFPTIGALVTDTGGILSHPAIIAREYRIPAVVATGNGTELLEDGQIVTVDGSTGTIVRQETGLAGPSGTDRQGGNSA